MSIGLVVRLIVLALLVAFLISPESFSFVFEPLTKNNQPVIYNQGSLLDLTLNHLLIVAIATALATTVAVGLAILVTRPFGAEFLPLSRSLANVGQTFPPVAVLALAVPMLGFGTAPTLVALFLYGLLPIFENTLTGLTGLPPHGDRGRSRHGYDRQAAASPRGIALGPAGHPRRCAPFHGDFAGHRHHRDRPLLPERSARSSSLGSYPAIPPSSCRVGSSWACLRCSSMTACRP